jgi:hypothetical protein
MSGKLRMTRSGRLMNACYYGANGWTSLYSQNETTADMQFSIKAWTGSSIWPQKPVRIAFDNFQINQGTLVPAVPEPSSLLVLVSGVGILGGMLRRRTR